jgi:hypothetical protein
VESAVVLDPMTGKCGVPHLRHTAAGAPEVYLRLEPGHSTILRTLNRKQPKGPPWLWPKPGKTVTQINGPWQLEFIAGGPKLPDALGMVTLKSWTTVGGAATESFGGTARYRCRFDLPAASPQRNQKAPLLLDLGEVKHVARVQINGRSLGVLIMHPYRLAVPAALLRPKDNLLEVEVTNLAANRIRDLDRRKVDWRIFHDINLVNIRYKPFNAADWPVFDSGLLGPVRIRLVE